MDASTEFLRIAVIVVWSILGAALITTFVFTLFDLWDRPIMTRKEKLKARAAHESDVLRREAETAQAAISSEAERYATRSNSRSTRRRR